MSGSTTNFEEEKNIKNWCQFVCYNNKSSEKSNCRKKWRKHKKMFDFFELAINFPLGDWLMKASNEVSLAKNLTG